MVTPNGGERLSEVSGHCSGEAHLVEHNWVLLRFLPTSSGSEHRPRLVNYLEDRARREEPGGGVLKKSFLPSPPPHFNLISLPFFPSQFIKQKGKNIMMYMSDS